MTPVSHLVITLVQRPDRVLLSRREHAADPTRLRA
jgi:hypothetical protein